MIVAQPQDPLPVAQLEMPIDPLDITYADKQRVHCSSSVVGVDLKLAGTQSWTHGRTTFTSTADITARLNIREDLKSETRSESLSWTVVQVEKDGGTVTTTTMVPL